MLNFILGLIIGGGAVWVVMRSRRLDSPIKSGNDRVVVYPEQVEQKKRNVEKVLEMARQTGKIANEDVEKTLKVSNATAERYLNELEKMGKIEQAGEIGRGVYYKIRE